MAIQLAPKTLLNHAAVLLDDPPAALAGRWPIAVAVLLRQALERSLDQLWQQRAPELLQASERAQLLVLKRYIDPAVADQAATAWYELSAACHQHAYELPPTAVELGRWYESTETLVREIARVQAAREAKRSAAGN